MASTDLERHRQADRLLQCGRLEEALQEFRAILDSESDPVGRAYVSAGVVQCLSRMGRFEEARDILQKAARQLPKDHTTRLDLEFFHACLYWDEGKCAEAQRILDRLLEENREFLSSPDGRELYRDIQVKRGISLTAFQRFGEACPILEEVRSLGLSEEQEGDVLCNLGACYYALGKKAQAKAAFLAALEAGVQNYWGIRAHFYLGMIYAESGSHAWAKQELELCAPNAAEAQLSSRDVFRLLAVVCRELGLEDEAERYAKLAEQS